MERCERYTELLSARLDGELTPAEERELEAHLAACPVCRALGAQLAAVHAAFPELEEIPAPQDFTRQVMDRVRAAETDQPKVVPLFRRPQFKALAGAAACFVLCLGVYQAGLLGQGRMEMADLSAGVTRQQTDAEIPNAAPAPSLFTQLPEAADNVQDTAQPRALDEEKAAAGATVGTVSADPGQMMYQQTAEPGRDLFDHEQYIRVCYGRTPEAPSAQILGSVRSLEDFAAQFPEDDLSQVTAAYGEEFFENGRLLAVVLEESSGSVRLQLAPQGLEPDRVTVLRQVPEAGTEDMAAWLILAEVDGLFQDGDALAVILEDI